jgi:hypothetical protein
MDTGWAEFREAVQAMPGEYLEARIGDGGWTRKQMLGHIGTWHDLTTDRLSRFRGSAEPPDLDEEEDAINARAARAATGRTTGEIVLRREVGQLTDDHIASHDWWAATTVRGNSFGHYQEHLPDLAR